MSAIMTVHTTRRHMNYFHIIRKRLITLGVKPKDSRQIAYWFQTQETAKGSAAALEHFKNVGDTLIGFLSESGYQAPWVATTQGGFPKALLSIREYPLEIQLRVAKIARAILLKHPTLKMVSKLSSAATGPYKGSAEALDRLAQLISRGKKAQGFPRYTYEEKFTTIFKSCRTYTNRSVPNGTEVGLDLSKLFSTFRSWSSYITNFSNWPDLVYPLHPHYIGRTLMDYGTHPHVGEVGGVMEQGGKLRIFAAPSVLLNNALEPLQTFLDRYRSTTKWDVFRHQEGGKDWVQSKMADGLNIHSIDLSSATCRFPFEVQLQLCEELGAPKEVLQLYYEVARRPYKVQPHLVELFGSELQWTVGQPLGSNPSMSSFALAHGLLLVGLCDELHLPHNDSFRIMGDDVVCCNDSLAIAYRQVISSLGIDISEHKSFSSKNYGEFAGFSILPHLAVRPGRWKKASRLNIVGLFKDLGAGVLNELDMDPLPAKLMLFREGAYNPDSSEEWNLLLKYSSLAFPGVGAKYETLSRSRSWFSGAVSFLQKELKSPAPYFDSEKTESFLDFVPESEVKDLVSSLARYGIEYHTTESIYTLLESFASDIYPYQEYAIYVSQLRELYEAYTWSRPLTKGRKVRDQLSHLTHLLVDVEREMAILEEVPVAL